MLFPLCSKKAVQIYELNSLDIFLGVIFLHCVSLKVWDASVPSVLVQKIDLLYFYPLFSWPKRLIITIPFPLSSHSTL